MYTTAEISLYPLNQDYIPIIKAFIERLHGYEDLSIQTSATSTQICGRHEHVLDILNKEMKLSHQTFDKSVFVVKFIPGMRVNDDA